MTNESRYYVERENYVTAPNKPDFFVIDRVTGRAVDVSSIKAMADRYCETFNQNDEGRYDLSGWAGCNAHGHSNTH